MTPDAGMPRTSRSIRVLLVEDNVVDAEVVIRELRRAGFDPEWRRVETEQAFAEDFRADLDLVISDSEMPQFSGRRALELRNQSGLDVPFILISGTIGEETAVEAMKHGASDYLMKDRLTRLGPAVQHALNECLLRAEKRQADAAVLASERHYRLLFESNPEPMWVFDLETLRFLAVNPAATDHYGFTRDEFLAMTIRDIRPPECLPQLEAKLRAAMPGRSGPTTWRHRKKDGTEIDVEITANDLEFAGRAARLVLAMDVTERKRAAELLQRQQTELRVLFDLMPALIWFKDTNNGILRVNQRAADAAGRRVGEIEGKPSHEIYPDDAARYLADDREIVRSGAPRLSYVEKLKNAAGEGIWVQTDKVPYRDQEGKVIGIVVMSHDITERKRAEIALRESEERFRGLIENATDLIAVVDVEGRIEYHSPSAQRLLGYEPEEILGRCVTDFIHPDDVGIAREGMGRAFAEGPPKTIEYRIRHHDGRWRTFQSVGRLMPEVRGRKLIVVNSRDVTETRELERQFLRAQRLEAIGTLSSGIAHDLNNILAPMLMVPGMLREEITHPRSRELLMMIESAAQRGANIIRQLLTFSRGIEGERVSVQWRHLIKEMAGIARETFPRDIAISEEVARDLWPVSGDATQLHQVLLNLCINARDAMPDGGRLNLQARNVELTAEQVPAHSSAKPGRYVLMEVSDSGSGIPREIIEKIFDPFFTTKEIGKGTGLGLSTVLGIVKSHGGFITVQSAPGKGTTFQVYLPLDSAAELQTAPDTEAAPARGQQELILLVDDEAAIRFATAAALQQWNYRVVAAPNGEAGLALFEEHRDEVRLVVTDLMMPVMGGQALIRTLRAIAPEIRVIAATGLDPGEKRAELRALGVTTILMKPYTPQALLEAVSAELGESATTA